MKGGKSYKPPRERAALPPKFMPQRPAQGGLNPPPKSAPLPPKRQPKRPR